MPAGWSSVCDWLSGLAWSHGGWPEVVTLTAGLVAVGLGLAWALTRIPRLPGPPADDPGVSAY